MLLDQVKFWQLHTVEEAQERSNHQRMKFLSSSNLMDLLIERGSLQPTNFEMQVKYYLFDMII